MGSDFEIVDSQGYSNSNMKVIAFDGDEWLGDLDDLSDESLESVTSIRIKDGVFADSEEYNFKINEDGGLTSIDGTKTLTQTETMSLVGGMDEYNNILSSQGGVLPSEQKNLDGSPTNSEAVLVKYENGNVYLKQESVDSPLVQLSEETLDKYWSETYAALNSDSSDSEEISNTITDTEDGNSDTRLKGEGSVIDYDESQSKLAGKMVSNSTEGDNSTGTYRDENGTYYEIGSYGDDGSDPTTLWQISQATGVSVAALAEYNNIDNPDIVHTGDKIYIPNVDSDGALIQTNTDGGYAEIGGGGVFGNDSLIVDYETICKSISNIDSYISSMEEVIEKFETEITNAKQDDNWLGEDKTKFIDYVEGDYIVYLKNVLRRIQIFTDYVSEISESYAADEEELSGIFD